jgi:hypothetical protein
MRRNEIGGGWEGGKSDMFFLLKMMVDLFKRKWFFENSLTGARNVSPVKYEGGNYQVGHKHCRV